MKRSVIPALCAIMLLSALFSSGCGTQKLPYPIDNSHKQPDDEQTQSIGAENVPSEYADKFEIAVSLISHPIDELYAAIGIPTDSSYASSCIGKGEDGELYYEDFTVSTYRENGEETVADVYK